MSEQWRTLAVVLRKRAEQIEASEYWFFHCRECDREYAFKRSLIAHNVQKYGRQRLWVCGSCHLGDRYD